ncbi:MAG: asparagine synthase (glutamine-hydrolyzing) [Myxococcaceae bacterium]|jgi:asparagine synthase (glutamine-hydrolysing)|nr:asparagine synthase (glutamine-hydrolyzing) [Myxococcaceae bacterium]
MCGITGVIYRDGRRPPPELIRKMANTIAHRGPDGEGVHVFDGGGLGHRRLAILDLTPDGAQPMAAANGTVWVVFNGEIYNFQELRSELEGLGHRFHSRSDTEVILEAWLEWGERSIQKLDGMFAIALWDARSRQLVLARDRTGKKPLYVYEDAEKLVFGSEIKAILAHPNVNTREWPEAAAQFLSHGYVPTPHTFYAQIRKVKPSCFEVLEAGKRETREHQYWEFPLGPERRVKTEDDWREVEHEVRRLFFAAVKQRMVADVPIGAFLSGGIDSSLVVAAMAMQSSRPIKTFSIGFEGAADFDETKYARMVADRYGTDHTEFRVKAEAFDLAEKLAWHFDEPFGDSSCIPTYIVSKLTREAGCPVALTGDGGDEAFAGYPRFSAAAAAEQIPELARKLVHRVTSAVAERPGDRHLWWRTHRFVNRATLPLPARLQSWVTLYGPQELEQRAGLAITPSSSSLGARYRDLFQKAATLSADTLNQVLFVNARTYLLDDLNVKVDRAAMAASLECRSPFLDTTLLEFAFSLPAHAKLIRSNRKRLLKRAFSDLLVPEATYRPKMGFGVPMDAWLSDRAHPTRGRAIERWADLQLSRWADTRSSSRSYPFPPSHKPEGSEPH